MFAIDSTVSKKENARATDGDVKKNVIHSGKVGTTTTMTNDYKNVFPNTLLKFCQMEYLEQKLEPVLIPTG